MKKDWSGRSFFIGRARFDDNRAVRVGTGIAMEMAPGIVDHRQREGKRTAASRARASASGDSGWESPPKVWDSLPNVRECSPKAWGTSPMVWECFPKVWASLPDFWASFPKPWDRLPKGWACFPEPNARKEREIRGRTEQIPWMINEQAWRTGVGSGTKAVWATMIQRQIV